MKTNAVNSSLTEAFMYLSNQPTHISQDVIRTVVEYVYRIYVPGAHKLDSFPEKRVHHLTKTAGISIRALVPSEAGLLQHIKRACIQAGYLWKLCELEIDIPNPELWGWNGRGESFVPLWQEDDVFDILEILKTCSCTKGVCTGCSCKKSGMPCTFFCKLMLLIRSFK